MYVSPPPDGLIKESDGDSTDRQSKGQWAHPRDHPLSAAPAHCPPPAPPSQVGENGSTENRRGPAAQGRTVSSWGCEVKACTFLSVGVPRRTRDRRVRWPTTQDTSTRCRECRCTCQIWTGVASQRSLWGQSQDEAEKAARRRGQEGARTAAVTLLRGRLGDCSPGVTWTQGDERDVSVGFAARPLGSRNREPGLRQGRGCALCQAAAWRSAGPSSGTRCPLPGL